MKSKLFLYLILVFVLGGLAIYGYFRATPVLENKKTVRPQIEVVPQFFDFGEVEYGQVLKYSFLVKNVGSKTLEIKRVATSCACTTAEIEKERIDPGQEAELLVRYNTGAMPEKHGKGEQERIIFIQSSDPLNSQVEIKIYADVK